MLFNSLAFAIFLPIVFFLHWLCPPKYRWAFLLAASYYFYLSLDVRYGFLLLFTTLLSYGLARAMSAASDKRGRKACLLTGLFVLVGILFLLKYLNFFFSSVSAAFALFAVPVHPVTIKLMLPVGISFYTFQTLGYLIDVYKGKTEAETHIGYYALFVSFFPQLLSGPIGRADSLLPQFKQERRFDADKASYGVKLMALGYFKKLVISNSMAMTVDSIFENLRSYTGLVFIIVMVMFAIQIYCDFSGYTDIAIGTAKLFGIDLMDNFKSPYFSHSIREFWGRWHISLSTWLRDYVYIPMGGNRKGRLRQCFNLMVTFLVSGLWHGASLTYIVWGAIHGVYQIAETLLYRGRKKKKGTFLSVIFTFLLVCFAWVFFRAETLSDAWFVLSRMFFDIGRPDAYLKTAVICLDMSYQHMFFISIPVLLLAVYDYASTKRDMLITLSRQRAWVRYPIYVLFLLIILLFSAKGVSTEFIYLQF